MVDLTIVMPARNEAQGLQDVVRGVFLGTAHMSREIVIVNDYSTDSTASVGIALEREAQGAVRFISNYKKPGIGSALTVGVVVARGEYTCFVMSDGSDSPESICAMFDTASSYGCDAVFGDRWRSGAKVSGYPALKRALNRAGNRAAGVLMNSSYTDWTNIFKLYRTSLLRRMNLSSDGFEIGLEMSLKAVNLEAYYRVVPTPWSERKSGSSKMRLLKNAWRCLGVLWRETMRSTSSA